MWEMHDDKHCGITSEGNSHVFVFLCVLHSPLIPQLEGVAAVSEPEAIKQMSSVSEDKCGLCKAQVLESDPCMSRGCSWLLLLQFKLVGLMEEVELSDARQQREAEGFDRFVHVAALRRPRVLGTSSAALAETYMQFVSDV